MPTKVPGQQGFLTHRISSFDERVLGKFTDTNHLNAIQGTSPAKYDKETISLYTQSEFYSNDFLDMIYKSTPYWIKGNTDQWTWEVTVPYKFNKITFVPDATNSAAAPGADESSFELIFERPSFQINDVITADKRYGDDLIVVAGPEPHMMGASYRLKLTGYNVNQTTSADKQFLVANQTYELINQVTGEFGQLLGGLDNAGQKLVLTESLSSAYAKEHMITKWADERTMRDKDGKPLDLIVFEKFQIGENGKKQTLGVRWEPFVEAQLRKAMMQTKVSRAIWSKGGTSTEMVEGRQEVRKHPLGIYHNMKLNAHTVEFNRGGFSLNLLRDTFGDLFYRRVDMKDRRVKLFTNEAGIDLFRRANQQDLLGLGLTIMVDIKDYKKDPMTVHPGFDMMYSMESGKVEISHLRELDQPQGQMDYDYNKKSTPIFFVFDLTNPDGGLSNNIRTVRHEGSPGMTWGYINGRQHHLGHLASKGMMSANKSPGYQMWFEDREDIFIEDMSKCVIIEQARG